LRIDESSASHIRDLAANRFLPFSITIASRIRDGQNRRSGEESLDHSRHQAILKLPKKTNAPLRLSMGLAILLPLFFLTRVPMAMPNTVKLLGTVMDEYGKPVSALDVTIRDESGLVQTTHTDAAGAFEFNLSAGKEYRISLNKIGFFRLDDQIIELSEESDKYTFTVNHEFEIHDQTEVYASSESIKPQETTHAHSLVAREVRDIPVKSTYDLRSSLQVFPEVVRDNAGQLHIAGGRTQETQYLLDEFDIGDPVTGNLSVRINVDSVQLAEVETARFSTRYGNGGAGVLAIDTSSGDDRWRAGATDFLPGVSLQDGLHLTSWYPRFTLSGPILKGKAWFSDALSLQRALSLVDDLPEEANSISQWAGDNMLRTQFKITPQYIIQGNFLYNQRNASRLGLNPLSPSSTTRSSQAYRSFFSLKQQIWTDRVFYELGIAADFSHDETLPYGSLPYQITPDGSAGNHYEALRQKVRRWQGFGSVTLPTRRWHGMHDFQFGFNAATISWSHDATRNEIQVLRADSSLIQQTYFSGPPQFHLGNTYLGLYLHDTWRVADAFVLQLGMREDWSRLLQRHMISPRLAVNILPFKDNRAKLTVSWGIFLQPVTLDTLGPAYDQQRSDEFFDPDETPLYPDPVTSRFQLPDPLLRQPRFYTTSVAWEQELWKNSQIKINFTQRNGRLGLAYEKTTVDATDNVFVLQNNRRDRYRSFQVSFLHSFSDRSSLSANYTRSGTWTNRIFDYTLDTLVFSPQESGPPLWDAPNRFVSSGWAPAPCWGLLLSYFFEYRTGFPFSTVNERQQLVGSANRLRYPDYASLNVGVEKRLKFLTREWAVRFTVINLISRENADNVINNEDSPRFMEFTGGQKRSFSARIRLVG
jgi:hypothetical protein